MAPALPGHPRRPRPAADHARTAARCCASSPASWTATPAPASRTPRSPWSTRRWRRAPSSPCRGARTSTASPTSWRAAAPSAPSAARSSLGQTAVFGAGDSLTVRADEQQDSHTPGPGGRPPRRAADPRADGALRPVRHEHPRRAPAGLRGLPEGPPGHGPGGARDDRAGPGRGLSGRNAAPAAPERAGAAGARGRSTPAPTAVRPGRGRGRAPGRSSLRAVRFVAGDAQADLGGHAGRPVERRAARSGPSQRASRVAPGAPSGVRVSLTWVRWWAGRPVMRTVAWSTPGRAPASAAIASLSAWSRSSTPSCGGVPPTGSDRGRRRRSWASSHHRASRAVSTRAAMTAGHHQALAAPADPVGGAEQDVGRRGQGPAGGRGRSCRR